MVTQRSFIIGILPAILIAAIGIFPALGSGTASAQQQPPSVSEIKEAPPLSPDQIPQYIKDAVNSPLRPSADKALDAGRKPEQAFAFFGLKPGMKVADLFAGGGYETQLLSLIVGADGKVYSQNPVFPERFKKMGEEWKARIAKLPNVIAVSQPFGSDTLLPAPPGSLDAVIIVMNYHDLVGGMNADLGKVNGQVFNALKSGGVYGVIDHSAKPGTGAQDTKTLHRIDENLVISQVEKAGFKLDAASSALRNPNDNRTKKIFQMRGETDRFMLKFVKP